jgi:hypothetical protein
VAQVRLVEPDDAKAGRRRVVAEPAERQLVRRGQQDQRVGGGVPVADKTGVREREIERRMRCLTGLDPGGQIVTGDEEQTRFATLAVGHGTECSRVRQIHVAELPGGGND